MRLYQFDDAFLTWDSDSGPRAFSVVALEFSFPSIFLFSGAAYECVPPTTQSRVSTRFGRLAFLSNFGFLTFKLGLGIRRALPIPGVGPASRTALNLTRLLGESLALASGSDSGEETRRLIDLVIRLSDSGRAPTSANGFGAGSRGQIELEPVAPICNEPGAVDSMTVFASLNGPGE
jgi:hypothetical protein